MAAEVVWLWRLVVVVLILVWKLVKTAGGFVVGTSGWRICCWYFRLVDLLLVLPVGGFVVGTSGWWSCCWYFRLVVV